MSPDVVVLRALNWFAGEWRPLDHAVRVVAGDHLIPMASVLTLVWLWLGGVSESQRARLQRAALSGIAALGATSALVSVLADLVGRSRPFTELPGVETLFYLSTDPSFPAHPTAVVVALGAAIRQGHRRLGNFIVGGGILMGLARVVAGNAWPSDILGGAVIGFAIGSVCHLILSRIEPLPTFITVLGLGSRPETARSEG